MRGRWVPRLVLSWLAILLAAPAGAQLFGTNKIAYESFDWKVYEAPHFNVHYTDGVEPFLTEVVSYAESAYVELNKELDHDLRFRVPLIVYRTTGEFHQTNITLAELPQGVQAFAEPIQYRMVLPIDLPPDELYKLIKHELVHIFEYSIFYEGYLSRALRSRAPRWLMEGLASYLAQDESSLDQMAIRDAVVNNILPPIQALDNNTLFAYRYGHAVFDYIEQAHGKEGLRSFLFEFKKVLLTGGLNRAIKESFGYEIDEFNRRFNRYLRQKYFPVLLEKKSPDEYGTEITTKRKFQFAFSPSLSPSGELIAAISAPKMEYDLVIFSAEDGEVVKNLTKGWTNDYRQLVTDSFFGRRDVSWSPNGDLVAVFARRENKWVILVFNALTGKKVYDVTPENIYECSSPMFSPDGRSIAFEGNQEGLVDIFEIDLETEEIRNLTQDELYDANPWYAADGKSLLYNRRIGEHWKIFSVDREDPSKKTQITFGTFNDIQPSYSRDGQTIYFTSDRGPYGVFNIHSLDLGTGDINQYTDVVGGTFAPVEMGERDDETFVVFTAYFEGSFRLYRMPLRTPELTIEAATRMEPDVEAEPFEPDLRLTADEDNKRKYKIKWDIENPFVTVGVTDDGTFLANAAIQFTDLLGNHRIFISANTVSDFASYGVAYRNYKRRYNWGATAYDARDYFVDQLTGERLRREYAETGVNMFVEYPISRHYRVESTVGLVNSSINVLVPVQNPSGSGSAGAFVDTTDLLGVIRVGIVGDTVRYQSFGPFQGKRFNLSVNYGPHISGDFVADMLEWRADARFYKQVTRRSLIAWRLGGIINSGDRENTYGFGGTNFLRGFEFREFFGSRIAYSNLEYRFPLVDVLRFPVFGLQQIRGFFFLDVGAAWYTNGEWYDPNTRTIRVDFATNQAIPFSFWDSDNGRLQDGRASYGAGFQFLFIGLQFNWVWSRRLPYTQYVYTDPQTGQFSPTPIPVEFDDDDLRTDFYITFDF